MSDNKNKKKGKGKPTKKEEPTPVEVQVQETNKIVQSQNIEQDNTDFNDQSNQKQQEKTIQNQQKSQVKVQEVQTNKNAQEQVQQQESSVQKQVYESPKDTKQINQAQIEIKQSSINSSEHTQVAQSVKSQNIQTENQNESTKTQINSSVPTLQQNQSSQTDANTKLQNIQKIQPELIKLASQKQTQSPQPIILISTTSNVGGSNEDLDAQSSKETKTSKRLAKFKQKQKKSLPKQQQKSPQHQNVAKTHSLSQTVSNLKSKFTKPPKQIQPVIQKDMDEYKMLLVMIQSKKRQNYKNLKQWDDRRVHELSLHLNIIAGFQKSIDNLARTSFENFEIYISTFKEIYNQQQKFASHPMIDTIYTTKNNSFSHNIYINCSCILNALNEQNMQRSKKAKEFATFIQTNILTSILDAHLDNVQDLLTGIKHRLGALKTVLINTQIELDNKTQKLAKSFSDNIMQLEDKKDQDFYQSQLEFLRIANCIVSVHKQYAELVLEYYTINKNIEAQRATVIKTALKTYSEGLESIFQSKTGQQSLQQLAKGEEKKLIQQFFSLQQLIPLNLQESIKQKIQVVSDGFLLEHLRQYFRSFEFEKFDLRQLILKQYPITNKTTNKQNSALLITVDKFIHIFSALDGYAQPTASYKIDNLLKIKRKGNQMQLETLPEKKSGILVMFGWSTKGHSSTVVEFLKKDSAEEAEDYIKKLV